MSETVPQAESGPAVEDASPHADHRPQSPSGRLVVFLGGRVRYAVALECVERVLPMIAISPLPGAPEVVLGVINLRGRVVGVVDPGRRLGLDPRAYGLSSHLLIVRTRRRTLAIATDGVLGLAEALMDAVVPATVVLAGHTPVAGVAALPDGVLLIHDIDSFVTPDEEGQLDQALGGRR
ncbi:MAG TPA: chemotaxis protein CheW [Vicinamibacteria bacterium]|nr:chemotaxis protein CheW [Vicinamibacteria bacterium]